MLFLLFQLGKDRYALEASRVVEIVPLLEIKELPQSVKGMVGIFNYRGQTVPAIDLCQLTSGQAARERLSTRIIIIRCHGLCGDPHLLGLVAENATSMLRKEAKEFVDPGVKSELAPYLGPVIWDSQGAIQLLHEQRLLSAELRNVLFPPAQQLSYEAS
jgi:chemotaxis-related protein WspB